MSSQPTPPRAATNRVSADVGIGQWARRPAARLAAPLLLFAAAFGVRSLPWASVLTPDGVQLVGTDAYYHMRRILYGLSNFPATLDFDRYINFPHGARAIWPGFFDTGLVLCLRPFFDGADPPAVERALVWVPPLLGAATVVALYMLALRHFDRAVAIAAAAFLSLLSAHFWYSQIGFLDHHAAVALASALLLFASMNLAADLLGDAPPVQLLRAGLGVGVAQAACLLLWPGMLLHVTLAQIGLLWLLALRPGRAEAQRCAACLAGASAVAFLLAAGFGTTAPEQFGAFSPVVLSRFQPWLFAALAIHAGACALLWRAGFGQARAARAAQALGIAAAIGLLSALAFPDLAGGAVDAWRWLGKREQFQAAVAESLPLFEVAGRFGVRIAETRLSRFVYVFPVALLLLAWQLARGRERPALLLLLPWALGLAVVTLLQKRFFNSFSLPLALLMGWSLVRAFQALAKPARRLAGGRIALAAAAGATLLFVLAPVYAAYEEPLRDQARLLRGEEPRRLRAGPDLRTLVRTAHWLQANTPETRGYFDDQEPDDHQPEYGVLSLWRNGHLIEYPGRRASVTDSFGDDIGEENFALAMRYFAGSEAEGSAILDRLGVRYVLAESISDDSRAGRAPRNLMERLFEADGNGLARHRMVFEASAPAGRGGRGPGRFKLFEHVAGARVVGSAPPGSRVDVKLGFKTSQGRRGAYRNSARAGEDGRYELRLPYATQDAPPALLVDPAYEVEVGERIAQLEVSEHAVQNGLEVTGPSAATLQRSDSGRETVR